MSLSFAGILGPIVVPLEPPRPPNGGTVLCRPARPARGCGEKEQGERHRKALRFRQRSTRTTPTVPVS